MEEKKNDIIKQNGDFLKDFTKLAFITTYFPRNFDYKLKMFDDNYSEQMERLSKETLNLLHDLSSYVNLDRSVSEGNSSAPFDDSPESILAFSDKAVQTLINSRDMDSLSKPPPVLKPQQIQKANESLEDVEKCQYGNYFVFFPKKVPKIPKFVSSNTTYTKLLPIDLIKPIQEPPLIVNSNIPELKDASAITVISDIPTEIKCVNEIICSFPKGPIFAASLNHRIRTYRPFCSLFLIMTPQFQVYIFDILNIRNNLSPLHDLLMNKNIVKIMYNANEDVKILAESHNLYITPLLDISLIMSPLPQRDENYQPPLFENIIVPPIKKCIIDWRIRPLNDELKIIAAQSIWYLPKIAKDVIQENNNFLDIVNDKDNSWYSFGRMPNLPYVFDNKEAELATNQIIALKQDFQDLSDNDKEIIFELVKWRDSIAVIEDESPNFIATNHAILKIATSHPSNSDELVQCLDNLMTPQLSTYSLDILLIVKNNTNNATNNNNVLTFFK